ncbi:MAG TPA: Uma2 family endonuclease [Bryobacteraceae bacterium]|nr:Uma2 family endonuclease [Bryobacteraceae bacterium]
MSAQTVPYLTPQEYLEIEEKAEYKSEYFRGQMWPLGGEPYGMAGGRPEHNLIAMNCSAGLHLALRGKCLVFPSDQRIRASAEGLYTYADCSVVCGKPVYSEKYTLTNPRVIVEVLSKTTESNDRGLKFTQYVQLESLGEYALVSQTEPRVEIYRRQGDGSWRWQAFTGLDAKAPFESVDCAIALNEIYAGVEF